MCPNLKSKIEYTQAGGWTGKALREGREGPFREMETVSQSSGIFCLDCMCPSR